MTEPAADPRRAGRDALGAALRQARARTLALIESLGEARWDDAACWEVPYRRTVNPPLWELGHVGWFQERWCLRWSDGAVRRDAMLAGADRWYDSSRVEHRSRWSLDLPTPSATRAYLSDVLDATLERLARLPETDEALYFARLALFHEVMHEEAFAYTWHALGRPAPSLRPPGPQSGHGGPDLRLPGGRFAIGSQPGEGFVFDNEKWAHEVAMEPCAIAPALVTNREFAGFVDDGGYRDARWWDAAGRAWRDAAQAMHPGAWRARDGRWEERRFDRWRPLAPAAPVRHVNAFEAEAWCRWAGRRLPTEAEWERAAVEADGFLWGGCAWEWTSSPFEPFAGFSPDPYADYSAPWFGTHRVVRGGSFATPPGLPHPRFRNFYVPERSDIFVGFRSCAA